MATDSVPAISIPGAWKWIDGKNDLKVQEVGKFAVDEYNKEQGKNLEFVEVLQAKILPFVNGFIFKLLLVAKDDDVKVHKRYVGAEPGEASPGLQPTPKFGPPHNQFARYEALVWVKPDGSMELLEFYPVDYHHHEIIIGGWTDAGNDVGIEDLAKFAVDEYNKKEGTTLEFVKLEHAQKQLVAGILYKLTLEAIDDGHKKLYQAMVIVIPWEKIKKLEDFKPLLLNVED